jgi:transposase
MIAVNAAHTSQTCATCGHTDKENRRSQAEFRCCRCGHHAHADISAAINIHRAGLAQRQAHATYEAARQTA